MIVYGRNAVREAIRGPADGRAGSGRRDNTLREPWLASSASSSARKARGDRAALRLRRPSGRLRRRVRVRLRRGRRAARRRQQVAPERRARPGSGSAEPRSHLPVGGVRGRGWRGAARASGGGVTPAVCKASAGRSSTSRSLRFATSPTSSATPRRVGSGATARTPGVGSTTATVDFSGPVVLVLGSEGRGLRPRVAAACDALISLPLRGRIESLSVGAAAAVLLYAAAATRRQG